jgi:predicted nucleotidyltransferase
MADMEAELSGLIGHLVDLRTLKEPSRYYRDEVAAEAVEEYRP